VRVTEQQIVTLKKVHFVSGAATLHPDASQLLSQVAQVLKEHPEIRRISIDGHTDSRGRPRRNQELSTARAQEVRQWLIDHGVAPQRMEARGFGASRPLGPEFSEEARERNRRVEFRIVDPAPVDVSATDGGVRR
jgi:outer membrane protein OmpA-like peptidoglycan-associated protein